MIPWRTKLFRKNTLKLLVIVGLLLITASIAFAQDAAQPSRSETTRTIPDQVKTLRLDTPVQVSGAEAAFRLAPELRSATGRQQVVVRLSQPALAVAPAAEGAMAAAVSQQAEVIATARSLDSNVRVLATLRLALNAVVIEADSATLAQLARNPNVVAITPLRNYELDLSETVPYIGATAVQNEGYDGSGVRVGVIDSGIDYTHAVFGGPGTVEAYEANDPTIIEPGTFPTARVVGGYDFVGSEWPNGDIMPDPDPLDDGPGGGHGTHVADIIGGNLGVAPGVDLYALKVCSSVSSSCAGLPLLQAMEFALDPNNDGDMSDHLDVINMSLGSDYGDPRWDDLSYAVNNASAAGLLTVASAGNGADKPYVHGTPAAAVTALAVAQTNVPSATQGLMEVVEPESIAGLYAAVHQPWSPEVTDPIQAPLQYGDGNGGNLDGCAPFPAGSLSGMIVLVNRGTCAFSIKISNIAEGDALVGIIGLVAPGEPFAGSYGGGDPNIPGFMIGQDDAELLKDALAGGEVIVAFDPANDIPLVGHMVGSSSRGPSGGQNMAKPDIGAPGASVSAIHGTGTGTEAFSGTSGAAPMVTGSAALLMDAYPDRSWAEIKSLLMNTAETNIMNEAEFFGGYLAAISRIGGGEVRVDRALHSPIAAWDRDDLTGSLSFGFHEVTGQLDMLNRVTIRNYTNNPVTLRSEVDYRYDNDANGEVRVTVPTLITVPANGTVGVPVRMFIRPRLSRPLHEWVLNSGSQGANPDALTLVEYDGYIHFMGVGANGQGADAHVAWHVLPRAAGRPETGFVRQTNTGWVRNTGVSPMYIDTYSLLGSSPEIAGDPPLGGQIVPVDLRWVGVQTYPVPAGQCSDADSFVMGLALNTWDRYSHASHVLVGFDLDVNNDGEFDYEVFNYDASGAFGSAPSDGRSLTWVSDLATGDASAFFFTQHETNSGNFVLFFCGEQIGMNAEDFFVSSMNASAFAYDYYYSGSIDTIDDMNIVPLGERYLTVFENGDVGFTWLPARSPRTRFGIVDFGDQMNMTETGVLWLYGPGSPGEARVWELQP